MKTKRWSRPVGLVVLAGLACCGISFAAIRGSDHGAWSSDWPKELEPYRERASTIQEAPLTGGYIYTIPFADRADFEKIWPVLMNLKSKGAPLILRSGGFELRRGGQIDVNGENKEYCSGWQEGTYPGVKIYAPSKSLYPKSSSTYTNAEAFDRSSMGRSTVEIELFVGDGKVIDLNRIRLPAETPIIDNRVFENEQKQSTTKPTNP